MTVRAITLHQPWAALVSIRAKPYETRSFPPPAKLIGQRIAIFVKDNRAFLREIIGTAFLSISAKVAEQAAEISRLHRLMVCAPEGYPPPSFRPYTGPTAEQLEAMPSAFDNREPAVPVELVGGNHG
jgi:hypothetical protein